MEPIPFLRAVQQRVAAVRGFSLVEMLVVLSIIVVVTLIAVMGQSTFNRSLLLTDTTYTIAFSVREAQTLGLSSRISGSVYGAGYGVRFSTLTPTSYILFADTSPAAPGSTQSGLCLGHTQPSTSPESHPGNCIYDQSATPAELVRTYSLSRGFNIYKFCGSALVGGALRCSTTGDFETMHITFMRPSTDTIIFGRTTSGTLLALRDAKIYLRSPDGLAERCVVVSKVGQVAVTDCL